MTNAFRIQIVPSALIDIASFLLIRSFFSFFFSTEKMRHVLAEGRPRDVRHHSSEIPARGRHGDLHAAHVYRQESESQEGKKEL